MMKRKVGGVVVHEDDLPKDAKIENDMIKCVKIRRDRGFILGLTVELLSGRQPLFNGYNNTGNIGYMILVLAELLGINEDGDCDDILDAFKGTPCRIATNGCGEGIVADYSWIGHFMIDRWILAKDVIMTEIEAEGGKK